MYFWPESMKIAKELIRWYAANKRDLPWRNTQDPYHIWLSEIILQQTRVEQGLPYYLRFIERFPRVEDLAQAEEQEVLRLWQGLGYYSRARNLHAAAKQIMSVYNSAFPGSYDELIRLKGVGEYTAAAISSFAFNEAKAVVDGNVFRFLARYFGIDTPINSTTGKKEFTELANSIIDPERPGVFNQAIMEFGALHCKPVNPYCDTCPFRLSCVALREGLTDQLPKKNKNTRIRNRYFTYFLIRNEEGMYFKKRTEKDIWQNMFDLPLIETEEKVPEEQLIGGAGWKELFGKNKIHIEKISAEVTHVLSHQRIYATFWHIATPSKWPVQAGKFLFIKDEELKYFALPRLIDSYLGKNS